MNRVRPFLVTAAALLALARPALAGPPLICFPFEIGKAASLPIGGGGWDAVDPQYDTSHLVDNTLALLTPGTPIIVRMETIRRATLYAAKSPAQATALLDRLQQRASVPDANAPLAVFDFGYLVETYRQATYLFGKPMKAVQTIDGFSLVQKAAAMTADPGVDFALAVMTRDKTHGADVHQAYLAKVLEASPENWMIEANVPRHFGSEVGLR